MRIKCLVTAFALSLASHAGYAAPPVWSSTGQPTSTKNEQGFFSKLMFGDKQTAPAPPTPTVMGMPQQPSRTASVWNAMKSPFTGGDRQPQLPPDTLSMQYPTGEISVKALLVKAQISEMQQNSTGARGYLSQALAKDPNSPEVLREIGRFEDRQERLDIAEQMYRRAVLASPNDAGMLNDLALCCARQGKLQESARLLSDAIRVRPEKTLYRNNIAKVLVKLNEPEAALRHLAAAHPPAIAQHNLGYLFQEIGDTQAAIRCYQAALAIDPQLAATSAALTRLAPNAGKVQVAAAPRVPTQDPAPASQTEPASEPWTPDATVSEDSPLLLPPVRE